MTPKATARKKNIDNILNTFISSDERRFPLAELQSQLMITSTPVDLRELNKIMRALNSLFTFNYNNIDLAVSVDIKLKPCPSYNSPKGCLLPLECPYLHVCEKHLKSVNGCNGPCKLNHKLDPDEIKEKLIDEQFDLNTLMKFYQTFYVDENESSTIADDSILKINKKIEHRVKKQAADQLERYKYRKPLDKNVFLSMIVKSKNEMWPDQFQILLKRERATMEIESNALVIMPVDSETATLESINDWFGRFNRILSEYFARFRMEKIKKDLSNKPQLEELKQRIDQYQKLEYQETDDDMIAVIGRLDHFADFLSLHPQFKSLFARQPLKPKRLSKIGPQAKPTEEKSNL